jgi:hypothetical protein
MRQELGVPSHLKELCVDTGGRWKLIGGRVDEWGPGHSKHRRSGSNSV